MTTGVRNNGPLWGNLLNQAPTNANNNLSAAGIWTAIGYLATSDRTLSKVRLYMTKTGTPAAADYILEIYSNNSSGNPDTSLATATPPASAPASGEFVEWTGLSLALTANTQYWIVVKNGNGTPASNFMTFAHRFSWQPEPFYSFPSSLYGAVVRATSNSGSSWSLGSRNPGSYRLEFSDSTFAGLPLTNSGGNANQVYASREYGVLFTSPGVDLVVAGVNFIVDRTNTPSGFLQYRIYQDISAGTRSLLGTTVTPPFNPESGGLQWHALYFSAPIIVAAGLPTRVVVSETTQADASSNRFNVRSYVTESDANSLATLGGFQGTLSTDGGSTFVETDTDVVPFALILGPDGSGSSEGVIVPRRAGLPLTRYRRDHLRGIL